MVCLGLVGAIDRSAVEGHRVPVGSMEGFRVPGLHKFNMFSIKCIPVLKQKSDVVFVAACFVVVCVVVS